MTPQARIQQLEDWIRDRCDRADRGEERADDTRCGAEDCRLPAAICVCRDPEVGRFLAAQDEIQRIEQRDDRAIRLWPAIQHTAVTLIGHARESEAQTFLRGLFAISRCDGEHEQETSMVAALWERAGGAERALQREGQRATISPKELAVLLPYADARERFLLAAIILALTDGTVSEKERAIVHAFADALGLAHRVTEFELKVKQTLCAHLHLIGEQGLAAQVAGRDL